MTRDAMAAGACRNPSRPWRRLSGRTLVVLLAAGSAPGAVAAQEFDIDVTAPRRVRFVSRAAIEEFEGVTEKIDGYVMLPDGLRSGALGDEAGFHFEVDLASLDTGIGLRNRHMRENYLETERYPYATFEGRLLRAEAAAGGAFRVTASGTLEIHGTRKALEVTCDVGADGAGYRVRCAWPVRLPDHGIAIPRLMFLKINEEVQLEVDFAVRPAARP